MQRLFTIQQLANGLEQVNNKKMELETQKYIDARIDHTADTSRKAMLEAMKSFEGSLVLAVENKIETKVNGKIKAIAETLEGQNRVQAEQFKHMEKLSEKVDLLKPILESYRDSEGAKRVIGSISKYIVGAGTFIGAWYMIKEFLIK